LVWRARCWWPAQDRADRLVEAEFVAFGTRVGGCGIGHGREERLPGGAVPAAEGAAPDEGAGVGLLDSPSTEVLHVVVVRAQRAEVGADGGSAVVVVARVVLIGGVGSAATADEDAGAISDLGVSAQRRPG
jgi:hypothetical protein